MEKKYKLRFGFEFGSGGCLWSANDNTFKDFQNPIDVVIKDMNGNILYNPIEKIPLSFETLKEIEILDEKYYKYLNQDNPNDTIIVDKELFIKEAKFLFEKIKKELQDDFEIIWDFNI